MLVEQPARRDQDCVRLQSCLLKVRHPAEALLLPWTAPAHSPGLKALFSQRLLCMTDAHAGLKNGIDEDELLARQIGLTDPSQMSSTQEKYKERIKQKLLEVNILQSMTSVCSLGWMPPTAYIPRHTQQTKSCCVNRLRPHTMHGPDTERD